MSSAAGNDLLFDESLMMQGRNFANKIWNGFRLVKGWEVSDEEAQPEAAKLAIEWYSNRFNATLKFIDEQFDQYRLSDALTAIYKLIWDDFSSWYLEWVKPAFGKPMDSKTLEATVSFFEGNLRLLHPFMPFITEEIWQHFKERSTEEALIISAYPKQEAYDENLLKEFERVKEIVSAVRNVRKEKGISFKESLELLVLDSTARESGYDAAIRKLTNVSSIRKIQEKVDRSVSFRVGSHEFFIPMQDNIDIEAEREKLEKELAYNKGFLMSVQKKLSNERFVNNAPEQVIANERKKEADALAKIEVLEQSIRSL